MTDQPQDQPVQNPLTLVLKAKSPQDYTMLRQTVEHIQALPPEQNPIIIALDKLATVHFARFVFLNPDQFAVITTYDGDFEDYINAFINELGEVFDQLLAHVVDAPPAPARVHRHEFLEFVRARDVPCVGTFYSAYPNHTVRDINYMASVSSTPLPSSHRTELPVSVYLADGQASTVHNIQSALRTVAEEVGFELVAEFDPVYCSFWQRFRAKASDPHTQNEVYERLIKLERSAEVRLLAVPESQANMQNAQGLAAIIESLKGESAAVVQLGPLVVVKAATPDHHSAILCRTLTPKEMRMLEARPGLLKDPCGLMTQLTADDQGGEIEAQ